MFIADVVLAFQIHSQWQIRSTGTTLYSQPLLVLLIAGTDSILQVEPAKILDQLSEDDCNVLMDIEDEVQLLFITQCFIVCVTVW